MIFGTFSRRLAGDGKISVRWQNVVQHDPQPFEKISSLNRQAGDATLAPPAGQA
jgi:hypothetical protein